MSESTANADTTAKVQDNAQEGKRARSTFTFKNFVQRDWIMKNVVNFADGDKKGEPRPAGYHVQVGRLFGTVDRAEVKLTEHQGKMLDSIALYGSFESVRFSDGEIGQATTAYLTNAYAVQMKNALDENPGARLMLDVDIGIETTGKMIPYEWSVTSYQKLAESNVLQALRARRTPRVGTKEAPLALTSEVQAPGLTVIEGTAEEKVAAKAGKGAKTIEG